MKSSLKIYAHILVGLVLVAAVSCSGTSGSKGVIAFDNTRMYSLNIEARKFYEDALRYSRDNKPEEAIKAYSRSIQIDPSVAAYNGRCVEYNRTGRYDSAIADANKAIMMNPRYPMPYVNRGNAYFKLNDPDRALKSYLKALQIDPRDPECYFNLGLAYYKKGLPEDALKSYDKTVELDPHHYAAWYNKSCMASQKRDLKGAIAALEKAVAEGFSDSERMKTEPALENVRKLPRFQLLLRKVGPGTKLRQ
jgi:tetratricopeptide (TPR) repeat protein